MESRVCHQSLDCMDLICLRKLIIDYQKVKRRPEKTPMLWQNSSVQLTKRVEKVVHFPFAVRHSPEIYLVDVFSRFGSVVDCNEPDQLFSNAFFVVQSDSRTLDLSPLDGLAGVLDASFDFIVEVISSKSPVVEGLDGLSSLLNDFLLSRESSGHHNIDAVRRPKEKSHVLFYCLVFPVLNENLGYRMSNLKFERAQKGFGCVSL